MERSYYIPSNKLKGENRILYIFTGKSLIYTLIGATIGILFYFLLSLLGSKVAGIVILIILSLIGYGIGTIKMPTSGNTKLVKNVGGDSIDEIIFHYIMFKKNKKVYSYAVPRKEPDYSQSSVSADLIDRLNDKMSSSSNNNGTKEENK
jgi:hypothetical protein